MKKLVPVLLFSLGLLGTNVSIAGDGCIYSGKMKATSIETTGDETPATVIIEPKVEVEQDPS